MKLSHINAVFVTNILQKQESVYAKLDPMTMTKEKVHQYLGIDYCTQGEVHINTHDFIKKMIDELYHKIWSEHLRKRGCLDLQLATTFLCTHTKAPDEHDYKKLSHEMKYLQATAHHPIILRADGAGSAIYIDWAHAVHMLIWRDMQGLCCWSTGVARLMWLKDRRLRWGELSQTYSNSKYHQYDRHRASDETTLKH